MERILAAIDLPVRSQSMIEKSFALSGLLGGELQFVHVMPGFNYGPPHERRAALLGPTALERGTLLAENIAASLPFHAGSTPEIEQRVLEGRAHAEILSETQRWRASLVVLGGAGGRGLTSGLLGSVSLRVLGEATVPVLLLHPRTSARPGRILTVIDGSETTAAVLTTADRWGKALGAEIDVVYALEQGPRAAWLETALMEQLRDEAESTLLELSTEGSSLKLYRPVALPYRTLPAAAAEGQYELVILGGSAGRNSQELGAHSLLAAHGCPCSALIVPAKRAVIVNESPSRSFRFRRQRQSLSAGARRTRSHGPAARHVLTPRQGATASDEAATLLVSRD